MNTNGTTPVNNEQAEKRWRQVQDMVSNIMSRRAEWLKGLVDPRRDIDDECGFPKEITPRMCQDLYERDPVAAAVVERWPKETWQVQPGVYEQEEEEVTPFEEAWDALGKGLRGEFSWYAEESGSVVWEYLRRADILSRIGRFGIILLGFDDLQPGEQLSKPVTPREGMRLLYMRPFAQTAVEVVKVEEDPTSPRIGQPTLYKVQLNNTAQTVSLVGVSAKTEEVHWTRVIHVADNLLAGEWQGEESLRPVFNNIHSLRKVYGASGEGYWKSCFAALSIETHPQLGGDVRVNKPELREMTEDFFQGLQRVLFLMGMSAKTLAPQVVDPVSQIMVQLDAICIKISMPKRVFMGSERGELASTQDDQAWNDRLVERQYNHVTPRIIVPFVDRLIWAGVLPVPSLGYKVWWPDITSKTDAEKAAVATQLTSAIVQYVQSGAQNLVPEYEFLTLILGLSDDEANSLLGKALEDLVDKDPLADTAGLPQQEDPPTATEGGPDPAAEPPAVATPALGV